MNKKEMFITLVSITMSIFFAIISITNVISNQNETKRQIQHNNNIKNLELAIKKYKIKNKHSSSGGNVKSTDTEIAIEKGKLYLTPIDENHPIVKEGYIKKIPEIPWNDLKNEYKYVSDFKVLKVQNSTEDSSNISYKVVPRIRLMKVDKEKVYRNNIVGVVDGVTHRNLKRENLDNFIYYKLTELEGYNFVENKVE